MIERLRRCQKIDDIAELLRLMTQIINSRVVLQNRLQLFPWK